MRDLYLVFLVIFLLGVNAQIIIAAVWKSKMLPCISFMIIWLSILAATGCRFTFLEHGRIELLYCKPFWFTPQFKWLHRKLLSTEQYDSRAKCSQVSHILAISGLRFSIATFAFAVQVINGSPIIEVTVHWATTTRINAK